MLTAHLLDTSLHTFTSGERHSIETVCAEIEPQLRERLPTLSEHIHLIVEPGRSVIPETGEVGFTMSEHLIRWTVNPDRDVESIVAEHLGPVLFHECHHAARLALFPQEAYAVDWPSTAMFEGLATVFEAEARGHLPPWGEYDPDVIDEWAAELFAQPLDEHFNQWKFQHSDGRRWIAYRVGVRIAQRAVETLQQDPAHLAQMPMQELLATIDSFDDSSVR